MRTSALLGASAATLFSVFPPTSLVFAAGGTDQALEDMRASADLQGLTPWIAPP